MSQEQAIRTVAYRIGLKEGQMEVSKVVEEALKEDVEVHGGEVFHGSQTPRNSARRALYQACESDTLIVRDGKGTLRFRIDALVDVVLQGDAWQVCKMLPDNAIATILSDPPHEHLKEHRARGTTTRMTSQAYFDEKDLDEELVREYFRVLKPGGYFGVWVPNLQRTSLDTWLKILLAVKAAGFVGVRDLPFPKQRGMGFRWTSNHESIWAFCKPLPDGSLPPCEDKAAVSCISVKFPRGDARSPFMDYTAEDEAVEAAAIAKYGSLKKVPRAERDALKSKYHDTEKPVEACEHFLRVAKAPGELFVECFAGTGPGCVAASRVGMPFVAVEYSERLVHQNLVPRLLRDAGKVPKAIIEVVK